jgi:hypothetical protein
VRLLGAVATAIALCGCSPHTATTPTATVKPLCAGSVVTVAYGVATTCDVTVPQRLDVVGVPSPTECDDMGGEYIYLPTTGGDVCEGVDY